MSKTAQLTNGRTMTQVSVQLNPEPGLLFSQKLQIRPNTKVPRSNLFGLPSVLFCFNLLKFRRQHLKMGLFNKKNLDSDFSLKIRRMGPSRSTSSRANHQLKLIISGCLATEHVTSSLPQFLSLPTIYPVHSLLETWALVLALELAVTSSKL